MALLQINPDFAFKNSQALFKKGIWTDPETGLTWMSCALGQHWVDGNCKGKAETLSWQEAVLKTYQLNYADQTGWRLPTVDELQPLLAQQANPFSVKSAYLPNLKAYSGFWTTDRKDNQGNAVINQDDQYVIQALNPQQELTVYAVKSEGIKEKVAFFNEVIQIDPTISSVESGGSSPSFFFDTDGFLYGIYGAIGLFLALGVLCFVILKKTQIKN